MHDRLIKIAVLGGLLLLSQSLGLTNSHSAKANPPEQIWSGPVPQFFTEFGTDQAKDWLKHHPFLSKGPLEGSNESDERFWLKKALGQRRYLHLTLEYLNAGSSAPSSISLYYMYANPYYPEQELLLMPNIWTQESAQGQAFIEQVFGKAILADFMHANKILDKKTNEYGNTYTVLQGTHYLYTQMTQGDEDAASRKEEKGYAPYETFFYLEPLDKAKQYQTGDF